VAQSLLVIVTITAAAAVIELRISIAARIEKGCVPRKAGQVLPGRPAVDIQDQRRRAGTSLIPGRGIIVTIHLLVITGQEGYLFRLGGCRLNDFRQGILHCKRKRLSVDLPNLFGIFNAASQDNQLIPRAIDLRSADHRIDEDAGAFPTAQIDFPKRGKTAQIA